MVTIEGPCNRVQEICMCIKAYGLLNSIKTLTLQLCGVFQIIIKSLL